MGTDPIVVPPEEDRWVMVGDRRYPCTVDEWVASCLDKGDRVWCRQENHWGPLAKGKPAREFLGVVRMSWFFDGINLDVFDLSDVDDVRRETLFPGMFRNPDRIWPERGVVIGEKTPTTSEEASHG